MKRLFLAKVDFFAFFGIVAAIKFCAVFFATQVFAAYTPLLDSSLYLQGYYGQHEAYRTLLIQSFSLFVRNLGGEYFAHYIFALASCIGILYYFFENGVKVRLWVALFLFLPSAFVWTSIVGKEAIFFGAFGLLLALWAIYANDRLSLRQVALLIVAFVICCVLRPHYSVSVGWLFLSTCLLKRYGSKVCGVLIFLFILAVCILYLEVWEELLFRGYTGISVDGRATRFSSLDIQPFAEKHHAGFAKFKEWLFFGAVFGIVGPTPLEAFRRPEFIPFLLEGLIILVSPFVIYLYVSRLDFVRRTYFMRICAWSIFPAILIVCFLHAPFGILNPGSATRWRTNFEQLFYMAPFFLAFKLTRK